MKNITVTVEDSHLAVMEEVAQQLRARGMRVERVLYSVGIITGCAPDQDCSALGAVEGVGSVDEQQHFRIPPPGSDVQ